MLGRGPATPKNPVQDLLSYDLEEFSKILKGSNFKIYAKLANVLGKLYKEIYRKIFQRNLWIDLHDLWRL